MTAQNYYFFTFVKMFLSLDKLCKNATSFYLELTFILGPSLRH